MADYITLLGAEGVKDAGRQIDTAAYNMMRAANTIDEAVHRLGQILEEDRRERREMVEKDNV